MNILSELSLFDKMFILLIGIALAQAVQLFTFLLSLVPATKKRRRKRFLKRLIRNIQAGSEGIWSMQLRVATMKDIREGVRRQLDRVSNKVKGLEEELLERGKKNKALVEIIKLVGELIPQLQPGMTMLEWRQEGTIKRKELWDGEIKKLLETKHGEERKTLGMTEQQKERAEIFKMLDLKVNLSIDVQKMKQQMLGKWNPREGVTAGGIDQEVEEVEEKIQGALVFITQIKKELKKV